MRHLAVLLCAPVGLLLVVAGLASIALGRASLSPWGWLWSLDACLLGVGLATWSREDGRSARALVVALVGLVSLASARVAFFGGGDRAFLVVLDDEGREVSAARWIDRLFEERDASMVGSRALVALGLVPAREFPALPALLDASYDAAEEDAPRLGTPVPATLLGLQSPEASDTIVVEPRGGDGTLGVVFLHGYAGSFALQCLEVARALPEARTACPATRFDGAWQRREGARSTRGAIAYLRRRGATRIVLAGLSAGGVGASLLAPRLGREIDALVLLSGVSRAAPVPPVPTLVVQGDDDRMMSTAAVRRWARGRRRVRYVELPGTHFVLLEERPAIADVLRRFVAREMPEEVARGAGSR
jgi:pimeloyl-ACP methyl ester carboxylesterase